MDKIMKRIAAMLMALALVMGQIALPAKASDVTPESESVQASIATEEPEAVQTPIVTEEPEAVQVSIVTEEPVSGADTTMDVPSVPGGEQTEEVEVDIVVSTDTEGNVTAVASTPEGGDVTDSGANVNLDSTVVTDEEGAILSEDTQYDATVTNSDSTTVIEGGTETKTEVDPGIDPNLSTDVDLVDENGNLKDEVTVGGNETVEIQEGSVLPSENPSNYDATIVTETEREVTASVSSSMDVNLNGSDLPNTESDYQYNGNNGKPVTKTGYNVLWYDEAGNLVGGGEIHEWDISETADPSNVEDSLYCVDSSTTVKPYGQYRIANLEDAVEEGYYTEDQADSLRGIMEHGYNWETDNCDEMNAWLRAEGILSAEEALDKDQAAAITQMAIWKYGNRFGVDSEKLTPKIADGTITNKGLTDAQIEVIMKAYNHLAAQTKSAPATETQIINQEKFIDDMVFTVGNKVENSDANKDNDDTNDIYNASVKFSMEVKPDPVNDDLIIRVLDKDGNVVKAARIAGKNQEGQTQYDPAKQIQENDKTYYVIEGLVLEENSNTTYNLKLEGSQLLQEGVYVFESQNMAYEDMVAAWAQWRNCSPEQAEKAINSYSAYSREGESLMDTLDRLGLLRSQNFITSMSGTADVDVSMQIDLTFNVEEQTVTTTRTWRSEATSTSGQEKPPAGGGLPGAEGDGEQSIPDGEVPLAEVPATGDASILWSVMGLLSMGFSIILSRKIRKAEEEETRSSSCTPPNKTLKRIAAMLMALALVVGQIALPAKASDVTPESESAQVSIVTEEPVSGADTTMDVPSVPGGEQTEEVEVDIVVSTDTEGNVTAVASTPEGGDVTDSGANVNLDSTVVTDEEGAILSEDTQYDATVTNSDSTTVIEGGTEITTEQSENPEAPAGDSDGNLEDPDDSLNMEVDLYDENGNLKNPTAEDPLISTDTTVVETTDPQPSSPGDNTAEEDPANFDETGTTVSRTGEVIITAVQVESGDILFTDEDGNPLYRDESGNPIYIDPETGDYVDAEGNKIDYTPDNGTSWQYIGFQKPNNDDGWDWGWGYYTKAQYYVVDAEGNETLLWGGQDDGLALRYVENLETGEIVGGLYCVDAHTGNLNGIDYRLVNLEDAAMEGYYTEEEAGRLRFIMENGYYTNAPKDGDEAKQNLEEMKTRLQAAREAGKLDLTAEQIDALTFGQAVSATGMAVWQYGNRNALEDVDPSQGETFLIKNTRGDETIQKIYEYLISGTSAPTENQVISQEKFVEEMEVVVGTMVKSDDTSHVNNDDDHDNDVYNVSLKFSLVVTPDKDNDDLIVKILDAAGNTVKTARIAGKAGENEGLEYLTPDEDGAYTLTGMHLAENTNTQFNLKLEGTQFLEEGVYVFTADKTLKEAVQETYNNWTTEEKWSSEQDWAFRKLQKAGMLPEGVTSASELTKEHYKNAIPLLYGYSGDALKNPDGTWNENAIVNASQNLIGKFDTHGQVDVGMKVDMTFNVEESIVTTTRTWRSEATSTSGQEKPSTGGGLPGAEGDIPDGEVPLAEVPATGDASILWSVMGLLSMGCCTVLSRKIRKTEEEEA